MKRDGGFTLIELLVTISTSALVIAAAMTLLLMGMRTQQSIQDEAGERQTVRIVLSMLEDIAASGKIKNIETINGGWQLNGEGEPAPVLLQYSGGKLTGGGAADNIILDNIQTAQADLEKGLLTFTFETETCSYTTSVYCRTAITKEGEEVKESIREKVEKKEVIQAAPDTLTDRQIKARYAFLQRLSNEYGSTGQIKDRSAAAGYSYYSQWYIKGYEPGSGWNKDTPWCACFLSWAAAQEHENLSKVPSFANVDDGMTRFKNGEFGSWGMRGSYTPVPGDFIFFDWSGGSDPDHVGAVLYVSGGLVYTIEGNSGGRVAVHSYRPDDDRIAGYGVLDWKK